MVCESNGLYRFLGDEYLRMELLDVSKKRFPVAIILFSDKMQDQMLHEMDMQLTESMGSPSWWKRFYPMNIYSFLTAKWVASALMLKHRFWTRLLSSWQFLYHEKLAFII